MTRAETQGQDGCRSGGRMTRRRLRADFGCAQVTHLPRVPLIHAGSRTHLSWSAFTPSAQEVQKAIHQRRPFYPFDRKCPFLAIARLHSGSNLLHRDISYWLRIGDKRKFLVFWKTRWVFFSAPRHIFSSYPGFHLPNTAALYLYLYLFCPPHRE